LGLLNRRRRFCTNCGSPMVLWKVETWRDYDPKTGAKRHVKVREVRGCAAWPEKLKEDKRRRAGPHWMCEQPYVEADVNFTYELVEGVE
jgi:hypothetical protein